MDSVGERIKQVRISKGISQSELAALLDTTKTAVSRYELGKRELRFAQVQRIAEYLGVSVFELYGIPSEKQLWMERSQKLLATLREQIQRNSGDDPDEMMLKMDDILQSEADRIEKELQDETTFANVMHKAQVEAALVSRPDEAKSSGEAPQPDLESKHRSKRVDKLVSMFTAYPFDAQNRILDVVAAFGQINGVGQKHAVGRIKELAEIPRYQVPQEGGKRHQFILLWAIQEYLEQEYKAGFNPMRKPVLVEDTPSYMLFELHREDNAELWSIRFYPSASEKDFEDILRQAEDEKLSTKIAVAFSDEDSCKKMIEFYEGKKYNSDVNAEALAAIGRSIDPIGLPSIKLLRIDGETVEAADLYCES